MTTKGRIEYQFKTYGGITVVFIEADIANWTERLNCFAQIIAECDGIVRKGPNLNTVLTFYSLCLDELSKWIPRTHFGDIV